VIFFTSDEDMLSAVFQKAVMIGINKGVASQEHLCLNWAGWIYQLRIRFWSFPGIPRRFRRSIFSSGACFYQDIQSYYLERTSLERNSVQRIWFDTAFRVISHLEEYMLTNGKLVLAIDFKDYRAEQKGMLFRPRLLIDRPLDKTRVKIDYKTFEVNQELDQTVFKFIPQDKNVKTHFIDDATGGCKSNVSLLHLQRVSSKRMTRDTWYKSMIRDT